MGSIPGPVKWVKGSGVAEAVAEVTAVAQIQSLAQELPYAVGMTIKKKKKRSSRDRKTVPRKAFCNYALLNHKMGRNRHIKTTGEDIPGRGNSMCKA